MWFDEEEPYDSDGNGPPLGPRCYVFNPEKLSLISLEEGIYRNNKKLLVVNTNGSYFLFDLSTLSISISSNVYQQSIVYYDNIGGKIILGSNEIESFSYGDEDNDDYYEEKYSLHFWDLKSETCTHLIDKQDGEILAIYCFDSCIFIWTKKNHYCHSVKNNKILTITNDRNKKEIDFTEILEEDSRIEEILSIEDKTFIRTNRNLYFLNNKTLEISLIHSDVDSFNIKENLIFIKSKGNINIIKIDFHEPNHMLV